MDGVRTTPGPRTRRDVALLVPLALAAAASQSLLVVMTPSMVAVARDLDVGIAAVGQARTLTAAVAFVGALVLLTWVSVLGVRRTAVAGAVLSVASGVAVAVAPGYLAYLLAHLLVGLAVAALLTAGFAGLAAFQGADRSWAAGWVSAAAGSSWVVGNPVVGVLTDSVSWRATPAFPAALALAVLVMAHRSPGRAAGVGPGAFRQLVTRPPARRWTVAETLANVGWTSVLTYVGALLIDGLGLTAATTGWLLAVGATCFVVASVIGGRLGGTGQLRALVGGSTVALAVAVVLLFGTPALGLEGRGAAVGGAVAFCLAAATGGLRVPTASVLGMAQHPQRPDAMMAARTAAMQAGYLLGAVLAGWVADAAGWSAVGPVLAVVLVVAAWLMVGLPGPDDPARGRDRGLLARGHAPRGSQQG